MQNAGLDLVLFKYQTVCRGWSAVSRLDLRRIYTTRLCFHIVCCMTGAGTCRIPSYVGYVHLEMHWNENSCLLSV